MNKELIVIYLQKKVLIPVRVHCVLHYASDVFLSWAIHLHYAIGIYGT